MAFDVHVWPSVVLTLLFGLLAGRSRSACPETTVDKIMPEVFVQHGKPTHFDCCDSSNYNITWHSNVNISWKKFPWWEERPKSVYVDVEVLPGSQNHILHLKYPSIYVDSGKYTCRVTNSNNNTIIRERTFLVTVYDCEERDKPVVFHQETQQILALGAEKTITCTADFGCPDGSANQRQAYWKRGVVRMINGSSSAFDVVAYRRKHNVIIGSNLTLNRPTAEDIELPFECFLFDNGSETLAWKIQFRPEPTGDRVLVIPLYWYGVTAMLILLFVTLAVVLYRLYGPKLYFIYKSKFCKKCHHHVKDGCMNLVDVGILHGTESDDLGMTFASLARSRLTHYGYTCTAVDHVEGPRLSETGDVLQGCYAVLIVFTASTFQDPTVELLVNAVLKEKRVVFGILVNDADGQNQRLRVRDGDSNRSEPRLSVKDIKTKYNGLQVLKWSSKSEPKSKKVTNFWYRVRTLLLPVPKTSTTPGDKDSNEDSLV